MTPPTTTSPRTGQQLGCAVVGGGAPGLLLAALLGRAGWPVTVLERAEAPPRGPRGVLLQPGTLQLFDELGMLDALVRAGSVVEGFQEVRYGRAALEVTYASIDDIPVPHALTVPLGTLIGLLEELAVTTPGVTVRRGVDARAIMDQPGDRVSLHVLDGDGAQVLRPSVVVAADGKHSTTRATAGIDVSVAPYDRRHLMLRAERPPGWPPVLRAYTAPGFVFVAPGRDGRLYLMLEVSDELLERLAASPDAVADHLGSIDAALGGLDLGALDVRRAPVVEYHAVHATAWHGHNVALLGDSAHALHSFGGQGINLGLQDATLLVDVVAAALQSRDPSLLGRFTHMRKAWVDQLTLRLAAALEDRGGEGPLYADVIDDMTLGQPELRPWTLQPRPSRWTV